jgi:hypothetical protein
MKKNLFLILVSFSSSIFSLSDFTSQSFVQLHGANQNVSMRNSLWHRMADIHEGYTQSGYQLSGFYQRSTDDQAKLAKYFTFGNKDQLSVKGNTVSTTERDVRAEWLELPATYNGTLKLNPSVKRVGGALEFKRALSKYFKAGFFKNLWIGSTISFEKLEHAIGVQSVGAVSDDLVKQFSRSALVYGRLTPATSSTGLSEVRLTLGSDFKPANRLDLGLYTFASIPGSISKQTAFHLFEAVRGHNRHFGFGSGVHMQFPLNSRDANHDILFYLDGEVTSFLSNTQMRVLDLKTKSWSRYLLLNKADGTSTASVPATTILTRQVKVDPNVSGDLAAGFRLCRGGFEAELGYGLWGHGSEDLELVGSFASDYGIAGSIFANSASGSTVATLAADDSSFTPIVQDDLDLDSGAARSVITHRVNSSLGYVHFGKRLDAMLAFGAFFELPQNNAMVRQWGAWAKVGVFF